MKRKKVWAAALLIFIILMVILGLNVFIQRKFVKTYTYTELEYRG